MMTPFLAIGLPHGADWIWILAIVLLVFGPKKLPELARGLGRSLGEFKKAKEEFEREMHAAASDVESPATPTPTAPASTASTVTPAQPLLPPASTTPSPTPAADTIPHTKA